jgi:cobalt transporter subunit CbtB
VLSNSDSVNVVDSLAHSKFRRDRVLPAVLAVAFGLMLLYAAGFAKTTTLHNAAHDVRHSAAIPCH